MFSPQKKEMESHDLKTVLANAMRVIILKYMCIK